MLSEREKFISIIDNDILMQSDAIILLEGDGFNRFQHAVDLYNGKMAPLIVFSGGITDYEYGSYPLTDILPHILATGVPCENIIHENNSLNTKEQAYEVLKIAHKNNWRKLILVASHEHQFRAYLTFLRQIIDLKNNIVLFNSPSRNLGWFNDLGWGIRFERIDKEFERINEYLLKGHLATFKEAIDYQRWKEQQVF
jgi:uncharacterized SAM-binding protein YcdF (DUF218 family)